VKEIKKIIEGSAEFIPFVSWCFVQNVGHGHKWGMDIRLREIKKIIEGDAESMPSVSWYFVQNVGHGHNNIKTIYTILVSRRIRT